MRRALIILGIVVLVAAGSWGVKTMAAQRRAVGEGAATTQATATPADNVIWASGKLTPERWAGLSPGASGTVREIRVSEGDRVEAGAVLVELDNAALQRQVDVAAAAYGEARTALDSLLAGATSQQIAGAAAEVAAADAQVAVAQAGLKQATQAAAAASAQTAIAQAQYNELASRPTDAEKVQVQREMEVAQAAMKQAQSAYDQVKGAADIGARQESVDLEQASARFQAAKAAYLAVTQGATREQLAVAAAQVRAAQSQAQVAAAQVPSAEAAVKAAEAQLARARAALEALKAGPTAQERAVAESRVNTAQAQLGVAQAMVTQAQVRAPFSGQVGTVLVRPGELAAPGQSVLVLGDTSRMRIETTDLRETDVTRLSLGMPVEVAFDALQGRTFAGKVTHIAPMSIAEKGSTNYTVDIELAELHPALRWGMTAFVNIQTR